MSSQDINSKKKTTNKNIKLKTDQNYVLDDFILQKKIGSGSFGKVFTVKDKKTGKIVVAKISINKIERNSVSQLHDISREVNILSKFNHPSILKFIFYNPFDFKKKPKPVIIMEYASNGSLEDLLNIIRYSDSSLKIDMTYKLIIMYGIASAMSYLHSHNIIHRDLKPENVLLDEYLFPKVADFGLSKVCHKNEQSMTMKSMFEVKGTPIYMSPEIWSKAEYTKKGDVYAFGIIVYELMTNLKPFDKVNFYLLPVKVTKGERPDIGINIPKSYVKLIQDCWSQEADKRPTFDEILDRLLNDRGFITETVNETDFMKYVNYIREYKSSFDPTKNVFYFDLYKDFNKVQIIEKEKNDIIMNIDKTLTYPYKEYAKLDEIGKKLVDEAGEYPSKQFDIGISLIEGREHFPQNTQIGLKYLKKSIEKDFLESIIYYCEMFIKGKIIPQDFDKAKKIADKKLIKHESEYSMILGKISKKKNKYEESIKYFLKSIEGGNAESMYEYGKMLYKGKGQPVDKEKSLEYFKRAIDKGHIKSMFRYGRIMKEDLSNNKEGNKYIKKSADFGYNKACYYYSMILEKGEGIEINKDESKRYLREGARLGHIESMFKYANEMIDDTKSKDDSILYLKKLIEEGHIESMYRYGMMLLKGEGVEKNKKEAAKYLRMAAYCGNPDAMASYGDMVLLGDDIPVDKEEALKLFRRGIELGNGEAMSNYAYMLNHGNGVPVNKEEAIKYYKMAIDKGNSSAMNNYGLMIQVGDHVPVNKEEAIRYYRMAIEQGDSTAMINYAKMLRYGEGVPVNKEEAIKYYKLAIEKGNNGALTIYIQMLQYEEYAETDREEAIRILKKAIERGDSDAMNRYAVMLYNGKGIPINKEEAFKYIKMSVDRGNINAMLNYAFFLSKNVENPSDQEESTKYFKLAIEKGSTAEMVRYANELMTRKEIGGNKEEAIKYYKMAIDGGNTDAMCNCADMLFYGKNGIPVDKQEALKYLKMAIDRGDDDAMNIYADFIYTKEIFDEDIEKYLKMAINRGNTTAMMYYGCMLYKGILVDINKQEGIKYLKMATDRGNNEAAEKLATALFFENGSVANEEIMKYFKTAAENGCIEAMSSYAIILYIGNGVTANKEEGNRYFKMAIDSGSTNAIYHYACTLFKYDETKKDESIKYFKIAADKGHVGAMSDYGSILFQGNGIGVDKAEAFKYFKRASEQGHILSIKNCGYMLSNGDGVPIDKAEASKYYKKAADKGDASSMNKYAEIIFKGDGVAANKDEGLKYFQLAIEKGDADAMCNYGEILLKREEIMQKVEGIKYIKLSSEKGSTRGMYLYGCFLEEGKYVDHDKEKSIKYFILSSNEGNVEAIRHYNKILDEEEKNNKYEEDSSPQKRTIKRRRSFSYISKEKSSLFTKLDEQCRQSFIDCEFCDPSSLFYIATSLIEGKNNFPMNKTIGKEYLEKSIKNKNVEAIKYYSKNICETKSCFMINEISSIYESSNIKVYLSKDILSRETFDIETSTKDRNINYELSKELSKESSDMGNLRGMVVYGQLCMKNKKNQICEIKSNFKESFEYIERAAKRGDSEAMSLYGNFLEFGIGCTHKDAVKAVEYYKKSCDRGNLSGCARYGSSLIDETGGQEKDITEGLRLIKHSFDHNDPTGISIYAYYLSQGIPNFEKDFELSFKYKKLAASMGCSIAINNVGACYHDGQGTEIDTKEAIKYYLRGIEEGSMLSAKNLGRLLIKGDSANGIEPDFKEGMKYLKYASENGNTDAMFFYSMNIANKKSTSEELSDMEKYLKKGVFLKDAKLLGLYGDVLCRSTLLPQDKVRAARYYKMCGDLGNSFGMRMYARCLSAGFGVEPNQEESLIYYKKSADSGDEESMVEYATKLRERGEGSYDESEVIKYYKKAIEIGSESGQVDLSEAKRYLANMNQKNQE
ncbi:hypothetical protein M9Y10_015551 [Tritrichomonas musculus]|uniref:Protein kinase domain-containing protein n=1 Tax=Tritrichomonas musculus TaxID=1915356 RepID=A0ABR2L2L8_9EUKA